MKYCTANCRQSVQTCGIASPTASLPAPAALLALRQKLTSQTTFTNADSLISSRDKWNWKREFPMPPSHVTLSAALHLHSIFIGVIHTVNRISYREKKGKTSRSQLGPLCGRSSLSGTRIEPAPLTNWASMPAVLVRGHTVRQNSLFLP